MNFIEEKLRLLVNMNRIKDSLLLRLLAQAQTYANIAKIKNWSAFRFYAKVRESITFWKTIWDDTSISAWVEFAEICFLHQPSSASAV